MWSRKDLKDKAKRVLRENYWNAFWVSIVIALVSHEYDINYKSDSRLENSIQSFFSNILNTDFFNWLFITYALTIFLIILVLRIFIGYSLEVGGRKFFIQSAQYKDNRKYFSYGFSGQTYLGIVKTMVLKDILIFLWSLLLIVPGIIKSYAYSMVPYILADNPNIGAEEAITLSNEMTKGHKLDMFILDLSFIGWYLVGILALGIGVFFVMPYENATNAELYLVLREEALKNNLCSYEDLLLANPLNEENTHI